MTNSGHIKFEWLAYVIDRMTPYPERMGSASFAGFGLRNALPTRNHASSPDTGLWEAKGCPGRIVGHSDPLEDGEYTLGIVDGLRFGLDCAETRLYNRDEGLADGPTIDNPGNRGE